MRILISLKTWQYNYHSAFFKFYLLYDVDILINLKQRCLFLGLIYGYNPELCPDRSELSAEVMVGGDFVQAIVDAPKADM